MLNLAQTDANKPVARNWTMTIGVEGHTFVTRIGGGCAEVGRGCITAPAGTMLVTVTSVTGNEEAGIERMITDQQLVRVSVVCSNTMP